MSSIKNTSVKTLAYMVIGFLLACQPEVPPSPPIPEEEPTPAISDCWEIPDLPEGVDPWEGWKAVYPAHFREFHGFNPLHPEEGIYSRHDSSDLDRNPRLYRYHFLTRRSTLLSEAIRGDASWSSTGWIAFRGEGGLYKITDKGEQLTQLTQGTFWSPNWSPDGSRLITWQQRGGDLPPRWVILDETGVMVDSISPPTWPNASNYWGVWSPDGSKIAVALSHPESFRASLGYYSYPELEYHTLLTDIQVGETGFMGGKVAWNADGSTIYWSNLLGIYSLEIATGEIQQILPDCENRQPAELFLTPDQTTLISSTSYTTHISNDTVFFGSEIEKIALDGSTVEQLEFSGE